MFTVPSPFPPNTVSKFDTFGNLIPSSISNPDGNVNVSATMAVTGSVTVGGNIATSGSIIARYQDVAEWVPAREPVPVGTVVVIRAGASNVVEPSRRAYDPAVAGVVSPKPGITLGDPQPGDVLVAHTGRVRVKVDATYGAIHAGDPLTTSPTPGHAMRSQAIALAGNLFHRPGTLLGKALEGLESGRGEILVLITLQ